MALADVVADIESSIARLRHEEGDQISASELRDGLRALKRIESQLTAQIGRLTHVADRRSAHVGTGARDTSEWLGKETGTSTRRNRTAADLGEAMAKSDELTEALTNGDLSADKAAAAVGAAGGDTIDAELIDQIADLPLASVRPATDEWRARQRPERETDRAEQRRARRHLRLTGADDGMTRVDGLLDPNSAAAVRTTLDAIMSESAVDGTDRTRDQRCADALTQLAVSASKGEIAGGRSNAKVLVTVPYETVCGDDATPGRSHAGPSIDATQVRAMCCDAGIHRVVSGPGSSILDFGHEHRLVSDNLFLALVARDQHCRWPGCTIRATWCDAHHVIEWQTGGRTSEDTCALLCSYHHSVLHLPGWTVTGDGHEFLIHHPDGSLETSRPPRAAAPRALMPASRPFDRRGGGPSSGAPLGAGTHRADPIGRELVDEAVSVHQLALI